MDILLGVFEFINSYIRSNHQAAAMKRVLAAICMLALYAAA